MMFEKYTFKMKFLALLLIFVLLAGAGYKRSFSTLFDVVSEYRQLYKKNQIIQAKSGNIESLAAELGSLDKLIGKEGVNKEKIQQEMIDFIAKYNAQVVIYDIQPVHEFTDNDFHIFTNELDLTGSYNGLMQMSYEFEKKFKYARLISLNFYTVKNNNNPDALHLKIIFQNYENIH